MEKEQFIPELEAMKEPEVREIAPGMTIEEIKALFFDFETLREPPYKVYQLNSDGHRYYYRYDESGEAQLYPSVTTMLKQVMPTSPFLINWMLENGKEGSIEKRDLAAAYGTFMHAQFELLIISRKYDFDSVPERLREYMKRENLPDKFYNDSLTKIRKDVLSFAQFVRDYNVKPLAIEIGLIHPDYHFAGCVDMPCVMTDPKSGETFTAIVDFKSGRKGFFEEHEIQLHMYRMMWDANFPEVQIDRLFNFAPKDWRKSPTYTLKDQTNSVNAKKVPHLLALATIEDEKRDNTLTIVRGVLDLDNGKIADNILNLSLAELIKTKAAEKDVPEQAAKAPEISKEEIESAEKALGISNDAPEPATKGRKRAVKATKEPEPINSPSEPETPVKTEIQENLPWEKDEPGTEAYNKASGNMPAGPAPEHMAEQSAKDNLLNDEIEL